MIGRVDPQPQLFGTRPLSDSIPENHVLRKIRTVVDETLAPMIRAYESSYAPGGDYGTPPEVLIRAKLLQALFSIRSERALCEQIEWNAAYRWFVGYDWDDKVFDHSTLSVNRERLFGDGAADALLGETVRGAESKGLLNSDRLVVDGTLIKAWASHKSFKAKDGSDDDKLQGDEAEQQDARKHDGCGRPPLPQGQRPRIDACLHRPCDGGRGDRDRAELRNDDCERQSRG